ncbi:MAG: hypothetical protein MUP85_01690 [Candidatus Lokiarchaeota archaeon]|nr:hypothetical protein [Candidatus Lokiarchaeota archaeon]
MKSWKIRLYFIIYICLCIPLSINFKNPIKNESQIQVKEDIEELKLSDIAGTDLYSENIDVYVAGNKSIIKQSLFTNDTSILSQFDTRDPAFYKCNVLISASNGITPAIFPRLLTEDGFSDQYEMSFNGFSGFLYYDEVLSETEADIRAERALEIIRRKFQMDLILVNVTEPNYYPFIGHVPDWNVYINEIMLNLPKDGYWNALDINRITSKEYNQNYHLSSTYFLVSSLDILEKDIYDLTSQVNFNLDSLDLSYLENLELENIFDIFSGLNETQDTNQTGFEDFSALFGGLSLSNESHYTNLMIQYEGVENAIQTIGNNKYSFNLWDALGYEGDELKPSDKIFIALTGAFLTNIDVSILCSDIIDSTPNYFELYEFLLEQIGLLLYYADVDIDLQTLQDYSFDLLWIDFGGIKRSYVSPINLDDSLDFINFLPQLGFQGIPGIMTGLFNPISNFIIDYNISNSEPNLIITKDLVNGNASYGAYNNYDFNITVENVGNETAWGVPTLFPLQLEEIFTLIGGPLGGELMDAIWDVVRVEYYGQYDSLEDFFNFDEKPRIFYLDSLGSGLVDTYFPNLNNLSNYYPYNDKMDNVIDILISGYPIINALSILGVTSDDLKEIFTNEYSIWNDDNWILEPGEMISYIYSNFSIEEFDTFTPFYSYGFIIDDTFPQLPAVISGSSLDGTDPNMALSLDNESWNITSQEKFVNYHEIEVQFLFQNTTQINYLNKSLDRVSILINLTDQQNSSTLEIFNFSSGQFESISSFFESQENDTTRYSFIKNKASLDWLFDSPSRINHTIVFRLIGSESSSFNISLNYLEVELSYRDINHYDASRSRVIYSTISGEVQNVRHSNSISLSTYDMASIIIFAELSKSNTKVGEVNTYTLNFKNVGSQIAYDLNISLLIPGIMNDYINFTLNENHLYFYLDELAPLEQRTIQMEFYTPNSGTINSLQLDYNNTEKIKNLDSYTITTRTNEVFYTARIDYENTKPFLNTIKFLFNPSIENPIIGEFFNISIDVQNDSPSRLNISNLSLNLKDNYGALRIIQNEIYNITNIQYGETFSYNITLKKLDWNGYYYPPINYVDSYNSNLLQISQSRPAILGNINLTITKEIDKNQVEIGDIIEVTLIVVNTGNICVKGLSLSDDTSFTRIDFALVEGKLINKIDLINPGENKTFTYKIKAISQNLVKLNPSSIHIYYLHQVRISSNTVDVKIIIPFQTQILFIIVPTTLALLIVAMYLYQSKRYNVKKYEISRNENILFRVKGVDAILRVEKTLKDYFHKISKDESKGIIDKLSPIPGGEQDQ